MGELMKPLEYDEDALVLAADRLEAHGRHHGWWEETIPHWRNLDPIGKEEFLDMVADIVGTYIGETTRKDLDYFSNRPLKG